MSIDREYEHESKNLVRDTRGWVSRTSSWLRNPTNVAMLMTIFSVLAFFSPTMPMIFPLFLEPLVATGLFFGYWAYRAQTRAGLPLRFPMSADVIDPNELDIATGKTQKSKGIIFLGNEIKSGDEVWLSDGMARTHMMFLGTTGSGKALDDEAPVLTPAGWVRMGSLVVGDVLSLPEGKTTEILGVYPQGRKRMFIVTLLNKRKVECCDEHLWLIREDAPDGWHNERVARTDEIIDLVNAGKKIQIPCVNVAVQSDATFSSTRPDWVEVKDIRKGEMKSASCVLVSSREHIFITGDASGDKSAGVVTHNTEFLLSVVFNSLVHGSGFIYVDGKADSSLYGKIYSMARQMGREDDVRVINFQTGAKDIYGPQVFKASNTMNPFSVGSAGMLTNLLVSLMSTGKGDVWEGRAISFVEALMKPLVFLRDEYGLMLDVDVIRNYFELKRLEELAWRDEDKYPGLEVALSGMISYLKNLPGYDLGKYQKQAETAIEQHGYITMQLVRSFNSLADTYGYIMRTPMADIDFLDVFLNRRILVVLLPALEKSSAELQNLGKIIVASIKATMAVGLGSRLEGPWAQVLESKPTTSPSPFLCVLDEYGYYAVEGFAVVPAQARSIGVSAIFAGQDLPAFQKSSEKEADSTLANTNTKACGKLICVKTAKYFTDLSGQATITRAQSFESKTDGLTGGFKENGGASIEKMDRVTMDDLMRQDTGKWTLWFGPTILNIKSFFASPAKVPLIRVNRMIRVGRPSIGSVLLYREANRSFVNAMAMPNGLDDEDCLEFTPIRDFSVLAEWMCDFDSEPGFEQAGCAIGCNIRDASSRSEAFDRLMGAVPKSQYTEPEFSGEVDPETGEIIVAHGDYEEGGDFYHREHVSLMPSGLEQKDQGGQNNMAYLGLAALSDIGSGDIDFSAEIDHQINLAGDDSSEINLNSPETDDDELVTGVPAGYDDDFIDSSDEDEWQADTKFSGQYAENVDAVEGFTGANVFGLTGETEAEIIPAPKAGQGLLSRDYTEDALRKIELKAGSTIEEAEFSSTVVGRKLADLTRYPITKPQMPVTTDDLIQTIRRLAVVIQGKTNEANDD